MAIYEFDSTGAQTRTIGGPGRGAGQLLYPLSLATDEQGDVYALDLGNERIVGYRNASGRRDTISVAVAGAKSGLCTLRGAFFTFGRPQDSLIRVISTAPSRVTGFGRHYSSDTVLTEPLSRGRVLCIPERGLVVVVPNLLSEVRAYESQTGRLVWSTSLPGYLPMSVGRQGSGYVIGEASTGSDLAVGVHRLADSVIAVQIRRTPYSTDGSGRRRRTIRTEFLRAGDGRYLGQQRDLPFIVTASRTRILGMELPDTANIRGYSYALTGPR